MNHFPFILAAYLIALGGTIGLALWSFLDMRRAEAEAERIGRGE